MKPESLAARTGIAILRGLAGTAILAVAAAFAARSETASRYAAERLAQRISAATGRPARVGGASIAILPPGIAVRDVAVADPGGSLDPPAVLVKEASATLSLPDLLRGEIVVDVAQADGVEVHWGPASPRAPGQPRPARPPRRFTLRRMTVTHGALDYRGERAPFTLEAADLEATAASTACDEPLCLEGAARATSFKAAYGDHRITGDAVSVGFTLRGDVLEVDRFRVTGFGLRSGGTARWQFAPSRAAGMDAFLSASDQAAAALLGDFPVRAGKIELKAALSLMAESVEASGSVVATDLEYPGLAAAEGARASFTYKDSTLTAEIAASGFSPRVAGVVPASSGEMTARITRGGDGESAASFAANPILYRDVLARFDPRLPTADVLVRAAGEITWRAGDPSSVGGDVHLRLSPFAPGAGPSAAGDPGGAGPRGETGRPRVDLEGDARLEISARRVRVTGGRVFASGVEAEVEATIDRDADSVEMDIDLRKVDLAPALRSLRAMPAAETALAQRLEGTATGRCHLRREPGSFLAEGSLAGSELALSGQGQIVAPFAASIGWRYQDGRLVIEDLSLSGADWSAHGRLGLDTARRPPIRRVDVDLRDVPASPLWEALKVPRIEGGRLTGAAAFDLDEGPAGGPRETLLTLKGARIAGIPAAETRLDAAARGGSVEIRSLRASTSAGEVQATGAIGLEALEGDLAVRSDAVDLGVLAGALAPGSSGESGILTLTGAARLSPQGASFVGRSEGKDVVVRGFPVGSLTALIESDPSGVRAEVEAPDLGAKGRLALSAGEDGLLHADVLFGDLALERLRPLFPAGSAGGLGGRAAGRIWGAIPLGDPVRADLNARITSLTVEAGALLLSAPEETLLTLGGGELRLDRTRLTGSGTDLEISGAYDLRGRAAGAGTLQGRFDARLLALLLPQIEARGIVEIDIHATALGDALTYGGRLHTESARLDYPGAPSPLENLKLTAEIAGDGSVKIEDVAFTFAGGEVAGEGNGTLNGLDLTRAEIRLRGRNMHVEPVPSLTLLFDGTATILSEGASGRIKGRLDVVRAVYSQEFELEGAPALGRSRSAPAGRVDSPGPSLAVDMEIVAPSEVWVRNRTALLEGSARLRITGTFTRPEVTGRISLFEGGTFRFREVTYRSEGGGIDFDDPDLIDPLLDLTARTQVREYEITLHVLGRYSRPRFELTSEPSLPPRDIVALLVSGKTYAEGIGQDTGATFLAEENVGQYLTAPLAETLGNTVGRLLNLTSVQIEPQLLNGRADPTARITLTKRVSPELLFIYSNNLGASQEQIYQFEYDLSRAWQLIGARDLDGSISGDIRFRHRWGGPPRAALATAPGLDLERRGATISRIDIQGGEGLDKSALRKSLRLHTGRAYRRADALEGREQLRAYVARHAHPLSAVRLTETEAPREDPREGGAAGSQEVELRYEILPGPRVEVDVEGFRRTRSLLAAVREAWEKVIDPEELAPAGSRALVDHLGRDGYAAATVAADVDQGERRIRVTFAIDRGPKVSVRSILFQGAASVPERELRRAMATAEDRWNTSGVLRTPLLKGDAEAIRAVYLTHGYLDARVADPAVTLSADQKSAAIEIRIEEGERWRVGEVVVEGATSYPVDALKEATLLEPGSLLRPTAVDAARERIREILDANGHNMVRVQSDVAGPPASARVTFGIDEGPRQTLDRIMLRGNTLTASRVLQREITLEPGDPVSRNGILETQRKLYSLGLFRSVDVRSVAGGDDPGRARLVVDVLEGDPLLTAVGAGYDTENGPQGFAQIGHNNVFGTGRSASLLLRGSAVSRRAQFNLADRRLFGIPFDGLVTAFWESQERESFDIIRKGGGVQLTRRLTREVTALGRYSIQDVDLLNVDLTLGKSTGIGERDVRLANVAASIARDTRDDILDPTRGTLATGDVRLYLTGVGSEEQFTREFASFAAFRALGPRTVVAASLRLGIANPIAATQEVTLAERFFAGGDTTLRGFDTDTAGPLDPGTLKPLGGEMSLLLNGEVRFPVYGALKGVAFYDAGNVFLTPRNFRLSGTARILDGRRTVAIQDGLRHVLGAGLRLDTPLGPLRLEYGRKLDRRVEAISVFVDTDPSDAVFTLGRRVKDRREAPYEIFLSIGQAF